MPFKSPPQLHGAYHTQAAVPEFIRKIRRKECIQISFFWINDVVFHAVTWAFPLLTCNFEIRILTQEIISHPSVECTSTESNATKTAIITLLLHKMDRKLLENAIRAISEKAFFSDQIMLVVFLRSIYLAN